MKKKILAIALILVMAFTILPVFTLPVQAAGEECEITLSTDATNAPAGLYPTLGDALVAVAATNPSAAITIKLLKDINYASGIVVIGKSVTFDVNGFTLNLEVKIGHALEVGAGGVLTLTDSSTGGKFNVTKTSIDDRAETTNGNSVYVHDGGKATVTNAYKNGIGNIDHRSAYATGAGSEITILGDAIGGFYSLGAYASATITVYGNVSGGGAMTVSGTGTKVMIYGNSSGGGTGVFATDGVTVYVKGNVYGGGYGVYADTGAQVIIDGYVRAYTGDQVYVRVSGVNKMQPDYVPVSSKYDYFEYNNKVGDVTTNVWVKRFYPPLSIAITYIYSGQIEYDNQNVAGISANKLISGVYDATLATVPNPDPTRLGYIFVGWFTAPNGGGIEWVFGAAGTGTALTASNGVDITALTLTLYAKWEPTMPSQTYTVTYEPGLHGTFNPQVTSGLVAGAVTPAVPDIYGERGWTFTEWSPAVSPTVTADATYVAQWQPNQYTIYYNANGGNGTMPNGAPVYNANFTLAPNAFSRTGYTFIRWNTLANGNGAAYADGYTFTSWDIDGDLTLYAQWKKNSTPPTTTPPTTTPPTTTPPTTTPPTTTPPTTTPPTTTPPTTTPPTTTSPTTTSPTTTPPGGNPPMTSVHKWALVNLILCTTGAVVALLTLVRAFLRWHKDSKENNEAPRSRATRYHSLGTGDCAASCEVPPLQNKAVNLIWLLVAVIAGVIGIVVFLFTEDMNNPMTLIDWWTVVNALIFIIGIFGAMLTFSDKKIKHDANNGDNTGC